MLSHNYTLSDPIRVLDSLFPMKSKNSIFFFFKYTICNKFSFVKNKSALIFLSLFLEQNIAKKANKVHLHNI